MEEQVAISYMSQGAISFSETDDMSIMDRKLILDIITDIRKKESEEIEKSLKK